MPSAMENIEATTTLHPTVSVANPTTTAITMPSSRKIT
jgi:hypothetical protein